MSEALRQAGRQLANVAFNWAQRCGHTLTGDDVALLDKLRKEWDAALAQPPAPTAQPAADDWKHLLPFGYAPGNYMGICKGCSRAVDFLDKRALHCRPCAEKLHAAAQPVQQPGAEFDHSIGADRFTVRRGSFWWHVRIGGSTSNVGKFHTKLAAEDMALKMLTAYRDGAFEQYQAARAHAAPAQRQPLSDEEIEAIWKAHVLPGFGERQRFYSPVVYARAIESAHGIAAQKGEKL